MSKIHKGDIGTKIKLDAGSDVSAATVLKIKYTKPDGSIGEWVGIIEGTQYVYYLVKAGDLDVVGTWEIQLYVETSSWQGWGEKTEFVVYDPMELYGEGEGEIHGNYITEADVDNWTDAEDKQETIDRVEQFIEKITQDYFYTKAFAIYLDGNGRNKLFLGLVPHVLGVTEILISGVVLATSWWTFDIDSVYLDPEALPGGGESAELMLRMKRKQRLFTKGMGNIKVTGTYGWSACPVAIKRTAIILCRYENDETLYTKYDDLVSDKLGDAAYGRGQKKFLTGVQEADRLVRNYIRKRPMMGVA